ncbi:anthranilate 1,2-dioxygenase regulatory protein AndR [Caballeronia sp. Lep1P3]|uniref:anthranilate 1,2-dioxygenase regulatory protein AndR n=1 Tax=Caballeronia sp. Lep1P3 TaxID=2878150 RepID=UPI001FD07EF6|nr:anthranilate 1,2-dioxygenase regulatory protein AndR [Caballeronia sp. Lep1P3]
MTRPEFRLRALRRHRLFESADLDETRELISRVMQPHSLVPQGEVNGRSHMDFVRVGRLGIGTIAFGGAIRVDVEAVDGYYLMMFCVAGEAEVKLAGKTVTVNAQTGIIRAPGEPFSASLSAGCEQLVMRIDPASLHANASIAARKEGALLSLSGGTMRAWKEQLKFVASSPDLLNQASSDARVGANLESLLVSLIAIDEAAQTHAIGRLAPAPLFIRRAIEFMQANLASPIQLVGIASAAGVPVRTLSEGFLRFRSASPMLVLRHMRLDAARAAIRASTSDLPISSIALDYGFTHLGRFAQVYKERFGELPSVTPRRA